MFCYIVRTIQNVLSIDNNKDVWHVYRVSVGEGWYPVPQYHSTEGKNEMFVDVIF